MNAVIYIVSVSLVACCICQEIIDRSYFSKGDRQSCCKNEQLEREIASKIEKLEHAILDLHEPLGNTTPDLQEQLRISTADIEALKESNSNLQEQLRNSSADIQALKASNNNLQGQLRNSSADIQALKASNSNLQEQLRNSSADIQALKASNSNLQEQLRNSSADIQALEVKLRISTSDIQTLNQSNLDLQEQLRQAPLGHATDCGDFKGTRSGVYKIKPQGVEEPFPVYCDIQTEGEGWTVFQRRQDGSVDFYQDWASYETGFGDLMGEFWLGNSFIHDITQQGSYELMVNMSDFEGNSAYAHYNYFNVGNASTEYTLTVYDYNGNAGDSLAYHNDMEFSTYDRDNDVGSDNCAVQRKGAWWYKSCYHSNLNGEYHHRGTPTSVHEGLLWYYWKGPLYSLKSTTMSVRRRH